MRNGNYIATRLFPLTLVINIITLGEKKMNNNNIENNLKYIKEMIEKTKSETASQWKFLLLWGVSIILAITGMHILVFLKQYKYIGLNWIIFMSIAVIIQIFFVIKEKQRHKVKTYAQEAISYLCASAGFAYILLGFVFPILNLYSFDVIPILMSVITGIILFTIGGIVEWNYLKWSGALWFICSVIMVFTHWHYRSLFFIPLIIQSHLVPALKLYKKYKNEK
jgi:uncharacterized membrane protein